MSVHTTSNQLESVADFTKMAQVLIAYEALHGLSCSTFSPRRDGRLSDGLHYSRQGRYGPTMLTVPSHRSLHVSFLQVVLTVPPMSDSTHGASPRLIYSNGDMKALLPQMRSKWVLFIPSGRNFNRRRGIQITRSALNFMLLFFFLVLTGSQCLGVLVSVLQSACYTSIVS